MITEDQLEQLRLDWFRAGGYDRAFEPEIAHDGDTPELRDYQQVVLTGRPLAASQKSNPHIPLATLEEAIRPSPGTPGGKGSVYFSTLILHTYQKVA